jgi:hypothetical protein
MSYLTNERKAAAAGVDLCWQTTIAVTLGCYPLLINAVYKADAGLPQPLFYKHLGFEAVSETAYASQHGDVWQWAYVDRRFQ